MSIRKINPRRTQALQHLASELDMEFKEEDAMHDFSLLREFRCYKGTTRSRKVFNLLQRKHELMESNLQVFDLQWKVSTGKSTQTFVQTMFFIRSQFLSIPDFYLRPEHFFHRIGTWLGMQDIDFVAYPDFSANNLLKGEDEQLVRQLVVTPSFARMFQINKEWFVEGMGYYLVLYKKHKILEPAEIKDMIIRGMELFVLLKGEVPESNHQAS